jgi:hypothetical protein
MMQQYSPIRKILDGMGTKEAKEKQSSIIDYESHDSDMMQVRVRLRPFRGHLSVLVTRSRLSLLLPREGQARGSSCFRRQVGRQWARHKAIRG